MTGVRTGHKISGELRITSKIRKRQQVIDVVHG